MSSRSKRKRDSGHSDVGSDDGSLSNTKRSKPNVETAEDQSPERRSSRQRKRSVRAAEHEESYKYGATDANVKAQKGDTPIKPEKVQPIKLKQPDEFDESPQAVARRIKSAAMSQATSNPTVGKNLTPPATTRVTSGSANVPGEFGMFRKKKGSFEDALSLPAVAPPKAVKKKKKEKETTPALTEVEKVKQQIAADGESKSDEGSVNSVATEPGNMGDVGTPSSSNGNSTPATSTRTDEAPSDSEKLAKAASILSRLLGQPGKTTGPESSGLVSQIKQVQEQIKQKQAAEVVKKKQRKKSGKSEPEDAAVPQGTPTSAKKGRKKKSLAPPVVFDSVGDANAEKPKKGRKKKVKEEAAEPSISHYDNSLIGDNDDSVDTFLTPQPPGAYLALKSGKRKRRIKEFNDEVEEIKPKKKRKPRAATAYMLWAKETRGQVQRKHPEMDFASVSRRLGDMCNTMGPREKMKWQKKAKKVNSKGSTLISTGKMSSGRPKKDGASATPKPSLPKNVDPLAMLPKVTGCQPLDSAAHLRLLGESLLLIGSRLQEAQGQIAVHGTMSVLLDTMLCALGPLTCLTAQVPELRDTLDHDLKCSLLDNIAYIMPGL